MASHLNIISGTPGNVSSRTFGAPRQTSDSHSATDVFAALLGPRSTEPHASAASTKQDSQGTNAANDTIATSNDAGDSSSDNTDIIAAAIDLKTEAATPVDPTPMVDFVEALTALKASLDRGEPLDPELLSKAEKALTALAEALGLSLDDLAIPEDFAALLENAGDPDNGLAGALGQLLAPLAQSLDGANKGDDASAIARDLTAQERLKSLGDKLAALLAALEGGEVSEDKLAALGMKPGARPSEEIETALSRFLATLPTDVPEEPVLAAPSLKTSEALLNGKPVETNASAPATAPQKADAVESKPDAGERRTELPRQDTKPASPAPANAANVETQQNATPPAQTAQDPAAIRLDAAANPRIVQTGYQTSQQQLNLPQIAFEMARQVQDGNTRFQIRLDPPELGRIDVRLDIDKGGQVHARLTVEKSETLDLMQRDQRALERALQQAGLDASKTNLEFSLKQNPFAGHQDRHDQGGELAFSNSETEGSDAEQAPPTVNLYRGSLQASGVNIIA